MSARIRRSSVASYIRNDKIINPTIEIKATGHDFIFIEIKDNTAHITRISTSMSPRTRLILIPPSGNDLYGHHDRNNKQHKQNCAKQIAMRRLFPDNHHSRNKQE